LAAYREMKEAMETGISVQEMTEHIFRAIENEQLYVLSHPEVTPYIQERMANILRQKNPL
jgi:hypothetical protein